MISFLQLLRQDWKRILFRAHKDKRSLTALLLLLGIVGYKVNTMPELGAGDERDVEIAVIRALYPGADARVWKQFGVLRHHISIEKVLHRSAFLALVRDRRRSRPEPASGDFLKKSDMVRAFSAGVYFAFFHSSGDSRTPTSLPLRVISWAPCARAVSINSLNFAFAS